jgi:hypothetical protein|tara:strand:- start:322 stop:579 length:258 start_codon:yes stop_codon:yes gene_type:complete
MKKILSSLTTIITSIFYTTGAYASSPTGVYKFFKSIQLFVLGEKTFGQSFGDLHWNWVFIAIPILIVIAIVASIFDKKDENDKSN